MVNDIKVTSNSIGGRQGWAYVFNSMEVVVIGKDNDKKQEYDEYKTYGKVRLVYERRGEQLICDTELEWEAKRGFSLGKDWYCISSRFCYYDAKELFENATAPVVHPNDIVALFSYSDTECKGYASLYKVGDRIDPFCMTVVDLIPLSDEEMQEIVNKANKWCNRR